MKKKISLTSYFLLLTSRRSGFTLAELLLVTSIVVILAVIATISFRNFRDLQGLDSAARELVVHLRDAQQRSITQEESGQWGIFFTDLAQGDYYDLATSSSRVIEHVVLDSLFEYDSPLQSNTVRFKRISGESVNVVGTPQSVTIIIKKKGAICSPDSAQCKTVQVTANGVINRF